MKAALVLSTIIATAYIAPLPLPYMAAAQQSFSYQRAMQNFQAIQSGKKRLESLSQAERAELEILVRILSRSRAPKNSSDCRDAWDRAGSAADDLAAYAGRLKRCAEARDFRDDCDTEFRRVRNAHDDYESASSNVRSYCD